MQKKNADRNGIFDYDTCKPKKKLPKNNAKDTIASSKATEPSPNSSNNGYAHAFFDDYDFVSDSERKKDFYEEMERELDEYVSATHRRTKDVMRAAVPRQSALFSDDAEEDFDDTHPKGKKNDPIRISIATNCGDNANQETPKTYGYVYTPQPEQSDMVAYISTIKPDEGEKIARDLAIAEDFTRRENLAVVGGALFIFNGSFYSFLSEEDAKGLLFQHYRKDVARNAPLSVLKNAAALLKYCAPRRIDEFPLNSHLVVFNNGTLEVETGRFRKNNADDMASSALGIDFDPTRRKMPNTKNFLKTIADGDDDLYERMLQIIGYILSNDAKAKSFFYIEGVGDAGKSRFCDLIASFFPVMGANKVARIALQDLGEKFALKNLVNAKLNVSEDLPDNPLTPTTVSRIKMISNSNRLEAEAKYVQAFSFRPTCKLLFASNHPLRIKEYDSAFANRVVYIPFMNAIPKEKQDRAILNKMRDELPALFNRAFEAYARLVANNYRWAGADRFIPEISVANSGITMQKEVVLKRFVSACCRFDHDSVVTSSDLKAAYESFCREENFVPILGDRFLREIIAVLPESVVRTKIGNQQRGLKGIRLQKGSIHFSEFDV